jgi:hypothetical protein
MERIPPLGGNPLTTLDVPVAGHGYNALPFIFDLVNQANGLDIADSTTKKVELKEVLPEDNDGRETLMYLNVVRKRIERITGDTPGSLGIHPIVYFYTRSGLFQPTAFLAISGLLENLAKRNKLNEFTKVRNNFEQFIIHYKEAMSILIHRFGSGGRSTPWLQKYYGEILEGLWASKSLDEIQADFAANQDFAFLTTPRPSGDRPESTQDKRSFSAGTKTAAFFASALPNGTRCGICGALIHRNSVHFDHIEPVSKGGSGDMSNAQVTHPYCDSTYKQRNAS